jgi:negative regulator of replication initiation
LSWARDALSALRKIILIEDRVAQLTDQVKALAESYADIDRRLLKMEAKFELIEKMAAGRRASETPRDPGPPRLEAARPVRRTRRNRHRE